MTGSAEPVVESKSISDRIYSLMCVFRLELVSPTMLESSCKIANKVYIKNLEFYSEQSFLVISPF
jgi:hypothetical protein